MVLPWVGGEREEEKSLWLGLLLRKQPMSAVGGGVRREKSKDCGRAQRF